MRNNLIIANVTTVLAAGLCAAADAPTYQPIPANYFTLTTLPNGDIYLLGRAAGPSVQYRVSTDNGLTFNTTNTKLVDTDGLLSPIPVIPKSSNPAVNGTFHIIQPAAVGSPTVTNINAHYYSGPIPSTPAQWTDHGMIFEGYLSSAFDATHTEYHVGSGTNDRLVFPFHTRVRPSEPYGTVGQNDTRIMYRDLPSGTWQLSPTVIRSAVPSNWNGANDGAVEPTVVALSDGTLQMWLRSQTGRLTSSISTDHGETWSVNGSGHAVNTKFYTTTGNPNVQKVGDNRLVMIWTNGTMPQRHNNAVWYAGRDALHAAVSDDDGVTWKGFREISLDPGRESSPAAGDSGVAQSFSTETATGKVLIASGQGTLGGRRMTLLDPEWLLETNRSDPISAPDPVNNTVENWSLWTDFGNVGVPVSTKRDRYRGTGVVDVSGMGGDGQALKIQKDFTDRVGSGAVWNFPSAVRGQTSARVRLESGSDGAYVALTDRFFNPTDDQGHNLAFYRLDIDADGTTNGGSGATLTPGQWADVTIDYNVDPSRTALPKALVRINGQVVGSISAHATEQPWAGLNYLRFRSRSMGTDTDAAGFLIDSVNHVGTGLSDAVRMTSSELTTALDTGGGEWTRFKFDTFVPNNNTTTNGNGVTLTHNGIYTGMAGVGIVIESSNGVVTFTDATSSQVTSDLLGPQNGQTLSLRFVDPTDPSTAASVSDVAFRLGSIAASNVLVQAYDVDGNLLPDWVFSQLASATNSTFGLVGLEDLASASAIHELRFTGTGSDAWLIGSFATDPALWDFAYRGLTVPEPAAIGAVGAIACAALLRRRPRLR